jgi:hypothetical protein
MDASPDTMNATAHSSLKKVIKSLPAPTRQHGAFQDDSPAKMIQINVSKPPPLIIAHYIGAFAIYHDPYPRTRVKAATYQRGTRIAKLAGRDIIGAPRLDIQGQRQY